MHRCSPLEGPHQLAQQTLQVEDLLHQETLDGRLLAAGWVDALSRLPPHQDFVLELCDSGRQTHTHLVKNPGFHQQEAQMFRVNTLLEMEWRWKPRMVGRKGGAVLRSARLLSDGRWAAAAAEEEAGTLTDSTNRELM